MLDLYTAEKIGAQRREALVKWFEAERLGRALAAEQRQRPGRLRMALGRRFLALGVALVSCEEVAQALIERRAAEGTR